LCNRNSIILILGICNKPDFDQYLKLKNVIWKADMRISSDAMR
jgi:hypothetical protein